MRCFGKKLEKKLEIQQDRVEGAAKVLIGRATGSKKLVLEGKAHKLSAFLQKKIQAMKR